MILSELEVITYDALPEEEKVCYQPATAQATGAVEIEELGHFAPAPYDRALWESIRATCLAYFMELRVLQGIDQDHDSGIYDVDCDEYLLLLTPKNCVLQDGAVVAFIFEAEPRYVFDFKIGKKTSWTINRGHADVVDKRIYTLVERK